VKVDFLKLKPTDRFFYPDERVVIPSDFNEYINLLKGRFKSESSLIDKFFQELLSIYREVLGSRISEKYYRLSYSDLLNSYFSDEKLKVILSSQCGYIGNTPQGISVIAMALLMITFLRDGIYYPKNGTQAFTNSIVNKFKEYGGQLILSTAVKKILCKNKEVNGVEIAKRKIISSNVIVSNADATKTFKKLIGEENLDSTLLNKLATTKLSPSIIACYMGIKNLAGKELEKKSGWYFNHSTMDKLTDKNYIFIRPSQSTLPNNVIQIYKLVDHAKFKTKKTVEKLFNEFIDKRFDKQEFSAAYKTYALPQTIEKFTGNTNGASYGWAMSNDQVFKNRLIFENALKDLFLVGHWANPGGGVVSVAMSGYIRGKHILDGFHKKIDN